MSNEFLSQDEVDALLKGVGGEDDEQQPSGTHGAVRPYDLATQERVVRGRMPTLEVVNERFVRLLRIGLFNFMRRHPEISAGPVRIVKYSEFTRNLVVPSSINIAALKPLRGNALFVLEPALVSLIVDNLFGGGGRFRTRVEGREFTPTEQRIIRRVLQIVFDDYQAAWKSVHPLSFDFVRSETDPQFASIATPDDIVVVTTVNIDLGTGQAAFHICVPYAALEPIRDLLNRTLQGDHTEPDKRWVRMLSRQVQSAEVELCATLLQTSVTVDQLMHLKVGDVIGVDVPATVRAAVDGVPIFDCTYGARNGQYAIRIERALRALPEDPVAGEQHG
ncbi:MAG: flagellar motor switch protein FliM [Betaproteobacteria bacterium]|nr:flagellar motor switch protein FliM [Betaproteobacteria bacterium]